VSIRYFVFLFFFVNIPSQIVAAKEVVVHTQLEVAVLTEGEDKLLMLLV